MPRRSPSERARDNGRDHGGRVAARALRSGLADQPAASADQYQPVASECAQAEQGEP